LILSLAGWHGATGRVRLEFVGWLQQTGEIAAIAVVCCDMTVEHSDGVAFD